MEIDDFDVCYSIGRYSSIYKDYMSKIKVFIDAENVSVNDFMIAVNRVRAPNRCLFAYDNFDDLSLRDNIARYYMQLNHSCRFTKRKDFRIYSVFADAILFKDGCFWKDG